MTAPFVYTDGIPATGHSPSVDYNNMRVNNDSISGILNVDMIGFNDANGGFHSQVTYVNQVSDPGSVAGQYREYSKLVTGSSEMFVQKDGNATPIQLTRGVPVAANKGMSYLPGGFLLQWLTVTFTNNPGVETFLVPFTTAIYCITLGNQGVNAGVSFTIASSTLSSVTLNKVPTTGIQSCYVMAIGI